MAEVMTLSIAEAAKELGVGIETGYELVKSGRLRSVLVGKVKRRVPRVALEEFIRAEMSGGASEGQ